MFFYKYSGLLSYIAIIVRDFATNFCMIYYIISVNRREDNIRNELEKDDSPHDLQELKTVLNSCRPFMSFETYVATHKADYICLLDYIRGYEVYKEQLLDLKDLEEKKARTEN